MGSDADCALYAAKVRSALEANSMLRRELRWGQSRPGADSGTVFVEDRGMERREYEEELLALQRDLDGLYEGVDVDE